jgi:tetratricopeptide (TPR) repeat protein/tRNA A-37 threonylcarbamoyl transferase component Bud32
MRVDPASESGARRAPDPLAPVRAAVAGRYEIDREIGQGAFATVYLARDLRHERRVAFKVLNADPDSETSELRFLREIRLLARLQHPNILPLIDSGHVGTTLYYVMPYVSGETLRGRMNRERQLPLDAAVEIARAVADGLVHAHGQGVIHRDIKPENILLSAGHPIIADFGVARALDVAGVRQLTRTGLGSPGTPAYMSPEQMLAAQEVDARSDLYSLGCVLYEMLTGRPPFAGKEGFVKRFTEPPPMPSAIRRDVPQELDAVIGKVMAREPADRYSSAADLARALLPSRASGAPAAAEAAPSKRAAAADGRPDNGARPVHAVARPLSENDEARDSYLIARRIIQRRERSELGIAERELLRAVTLDPAFARAHVLLGVLHLLRADLDEPIEAALREGVNAAKRAIEQDAQLGEAHAVMGFAATLAWEWSAAADAFAKAITYGGDSTIVHHWYAINQCARGNLDAARRSLARAIELDAENASLHAAAGMVATYQRDAACALRCHLRACELDPASPLFVTLLGMAESMAEDTDAALLTCTRAVELAGRVDPMMLACRGWTLARAGRRDDARAERESLFALEQRYDISPFYRAALSASVGETEDAIAALRRAHDRCDGWLLALAVHPWMDPLRTTKEYAELVTTIGLKEARG